MAEELGSVGTVEAVPTGLGGHYLRRERRGEDGNLAFQYPDPNIAALLKSLVQRDIDENYWGKTYPHTVYPVAADIANAAFPGTWPPYEPRRLPQDEEAMVLRLRAKGLAGDPVAGRETPDERMERTMYDHLDGTSQAWNV